MTRRTITISVAGLLAFGIGFVTALHSAPAEERFDMKVRSQFFAGFRGDQQALEAGMTACKDALQQNPKNAEALVWHGAGDYFLGGQAFQNGDAAKGSELVQKGLTAMSDAVQMDPNNVAVLIPRGATLLQSTIFMPDTVPFKQQLIKQGIGDFEKTLQLQKDYFATLGTHERGELLSGIANGYSRLGDQRRATEYFDRIAAELANTEYQKRADLWLNTKTLAPDQQQCYGCHISK